MVDNLWAIINDVLPSVNLSIAFCTNSSVLVSTLLVASSKIKNGAFCIIPRAIVSNCLWPADTESLSLRIVSYPSDNVLIKWSSPTVLQTFSTISIETFGVL